MARAPKNPNSNGKAFGGPQSLNAAIKSICDIMRRERPFGRSQTVKTLGLRHPAELAKLAASLKAEHNLPYADCFAAALAQAQKAALVTRDKDFDHVGTAVKTLWV